MTFTEGTSSLVIDDWANFIVNLAMVIIALVSAIYAVIAYNHQRNRGKKDAACKLAKHYVNVILEDHGFISNVYSVTELDSYIRNTIDINKVHDFDKVELERILSQKGIDRTDFLQRIEYIDPTCIVKCRLARVRTASERLYTYDEFSKLNGANTMFLVTVFIVQ